MAISGSGYVCPVAGSVAFGDTWGAARSGGRRHQGVDMMAPSAPRSSPSPRGTVTMKFNSLGGNSIWLDGDAGDRYYYAHLSATWGVESPVSARAR